MKNLIVFGMMLASLFINRPAAAQEINVYDEYYAIHNGKVSDKIVLQEQKKFDSPEEINLYPFLFVGKLRESAVRETVDEKGHLTELTERKDNQTYITHQYTYDDWGSIKEEKCETSSSDGVQKSLITYEYIYLDNFTYAKKKGRNYISGMEPDYNSFWVRCTVKKDGEIIQSINRKIRSRSSN